MRPMRRVRRQVSDPAEIRALVERCRTVRIGAVDEDGVFVVPMSFGCEWVEASEPASPGRLVLYLHSASEGRKVATFSRGPRVAIEMDVELGVITGDFSCAYSFSYQSVMGSGRIAPVGDSAEKRRALALIMRHMAPCAPCGTSGEFSFSDEAVGRVAVFRIDVDELTVKQRL